jgi:hypothetical protein
MLRAVKLGDDAPDAPLQEWPPLLGTLPAVAHGSPATAPRGILRHDNDIRVGRRGQLRFADEQKKARSCACARTLSRLACSPTPPPNTMHTGGRPRHRHGSPA